MALGTVAFQDRPWTDKSNGDVVVAIIRNGKLITMMFRRHTQPWTASALGVDKVIP